MSFAFLDTLSEANGGFFFFPCLISPSFMLASLLSHSIAPAVKNKKTWSTNQKFNHLFCFLHFFFFLEATAHYGYCSTNSLGKHNKRTESKNGSFHPQTGCPKNVSGHRSNVRRGAPVQSVTQCYPEINLKSPPGNKHYSPH